MTQVQGYYRQGHHVSGYTRRDSQPEQSDADRERAEKAAAFAGRRKATGLSETQQRKRDRFQARYSAELDGARSAAAYGEGKRAKAKAAAHGRKTRAHLRKAKRKRSTVSARLGHVAAAWFHHRRRKRWAS